MLGPHENVLWSAALQPGAHGRDSSCGYPREHYLEELPGVRKATLDALATRDDAWLERTVAVAPGINAHRAWFHVVEDEVNHRSQIRWRRARLSQRQIGDRVT